MLLCCGLQANQTLAFFICLLGPAQSGAISVRTDPMAFVAGDIQGVWILHT